MEKKIFFDVSALEHVLDSTGGRLEDVAPFRDPDEWEFESFDEAMDFVDKASKAKGAVMVYGRGNYGHGCIARNVYEIGCFVYDEERDDYVECDEIINGIDCGRLPLRIDPLDYRPEIKQALLKAMRNFGCITNYVEEGEH